jgi:putative aldouronate transport system permease protein
MNYRMSKTAFPLIYTITNVWKGFGFGSILYFATITSIDPQLYESAKMDGANVFQMLIRIYIPLSTPIMAVIAVYTMVGVWNSWFSALVYLPSLDWQPLQLYLRRMLVLAEAPVSLMSPDQAQQMAALKLSYAQLKFAMIIFSSLPVLFTYPFFQRYFMKGIMLGSLKE